VWRLFIQHHHWRLSSWRSKEKTFHAAADYEYPFSALTPLVMWQEGHLACNKCTPIIPNPAVLFWRLLRVSDLRKNRPVKQKLKVAVDSLQLIICICLLLFMYSVVCVNWTHAILYSILSFNGDLGAVCATLLEAIPSIERVSWNACLLCFTS